MVTKRIVVMAGALVALGGSDVVVGRPDVATLTGTVSHQKQVVVFLEEAGHETFGVSRPIEESIAKAKPADEPRVELDQIALVFEPHVLTIEQGTVVEFVNSDDLLHNIHLYRGSDMETLLNVGMPLKGMRLPYRFDAPQEVVVLCDVHSEMSAYILVLPNKHFAMADAGGHVEISNLTTGGYILHTWKEGKKLKRTRIEIVEGPNRF